MNESVVTPEALREMANDLEKTADIMSRVMNVFHAAVGGYKYGEEVRWSPVELRKAASELRADAERKEKERAMEIAVLSLISRELTIERAKAPAAFLHTQGSIERVSELIFAELTRRFTLAERAGA
ncbi:Uncharacterised protein [Mycobacteroides abscessus subsp. massiliense]|uniref:hypothetical protein n=1 Tax=Mycobacteroides abscessus TaxID=36809 RepID=UPI0009A6BDF8|nr:hypothetical protein [Mycobacteroides abscessus]SKM81744.1 Uncharacterised protein [Mycobacteroides abscessus subsp. massiliense]SKM98413.1 Uncharacterised protein [Mycobacteroides abscessus subsp. massiliense]SKN77082.1 Uncharacterised protein [Mycobacteroides abscessus subsp. massiliense]SKN96053.1 Uncharacterised protein [Mycobacteroides abscessus subsp. massiliense]SKO22369.1 Uncharacterised protein [Mycobacteroides abscessus subsp. massiliense]